MKLRRGTAGDRMISYPSMGQIDDATGSRRRSRVIEMIQSERLSIPGERVTDIHKSENHGPFDAVPSYPFLPLSVLQCRL